MSNSRALSTATVLIGALIVGAAGGFLGASIYGKVASEGSDNGGTIVVPPGHGTVEIKTDKDAIADAVAKAEAAVVRIETRSTRQPRNMWEYMMGMVPQEGLGSGFIFSYEGRKLILTNAHVVAGADEIAIELIGGRMLKGRLVGAEIESDVAIVEPVEPPTDLTALELADSEAVRVGEWVVAMGNPFGYTGTVTVGVISAKGIRPVGRDTQRNVIQTDAAINQGNSGGPLVNLAGQAIGINYSIFSPNQEMTTVGIGFAIPINEVKLMSHFLIHGGPWLGIGDIMPNSAGFAQWAGLATDQGVVVMNVVKGSPAAGTGIVRGDVLLSINGEQVRNAEELREAILKNEIGDELELLINREGTEKAVKVVAGRIPR
jgi:serine protease Do